MTASGNPHIEVRDGVASILGTGIKVRGIIISHLNYGWDGQELQANLPHLTLGQVYAALSYYYDHKAEMDADLDEGERIAEALRPRLEGPAIRAKLLSARRRPGERARAAGERA